MAKARKARRPKKRTVRPFPASSFAEALEFARELFNMGSGQRVRRLTLFDHLKKAPESGPSRLLITNAGRYGLITGSYNAEWLAMTEAGIEAVDESLPQQTRAMARVTLAIERIPPFNALYERFVGNRLPARAVMIDAIKELRVAEEFAEEGVDTFIVNLRFVGLLQTLSGAERIVTFDHVLEELPTIELSRSGVTVPRAESRDVITQEQATFATTCFYITPIGDPGSDERKHSDLFLGNIVEPALSSFNLTVIRADGIDKPGMITRQIIEYLLKSRLVIADLSFHNPNVFYELAIRHAVRLPIVQIVRTADRLPFDVHQMRTVVIDNSDIYALVPKIETHRAEIANQVRRALETDAEVDTPISIYFPDFRVTT